MVITYYLFIGFTQLMFIYFQARPDVDLSGPDNHFLAIQVLFMLITLTQRKHCVYICTCNYTVQYTLTANLAN